jgi:hypothetical protein
VWQLIGAIAYFGLGLAVLTVLGFVAVLALVQTRIDRRRRKEKIA